MPPTFPPPAAAAHRRGYDVAGAGDSGARCCLLRRRVQELFKAWIPRPALTGTTGRRYPLAPHTGQAPMP